MAKFVAEPLESRVFLTAAVPGFSEQTYAQGLTQPVAMAFAPDGRLFVTEQAGTLRVIKDGQLLPAPFLSVPADINGERGLLGVEFDSDYATNRHVYIYWTAKEPTLHNRISRFTADAANPDVAVPGSRVDLLDLPEVSATTHNGGALRFGPDGKLYVGVGENSVPSRAQLLDNPFGKILRLNKDGSIPGDNPFAAQATGQGRAIWALGLRNPFTFSFQPGTGRMFINDVGQNTFEEVNEGVAGANYGWPTVEGPTTDPRFRGPVHSYRHVGDKTTSGGVIAGSAFYNPPADASDRLPDSFTGRYFYGDGLGRFVRTINPQSPATASAFGTNVPNAVDIDVGPDGAVYVLNRNNGYGAALVPGRVLRYTFNGTGAPSVGTPPVARTVATGESATFTVEASGTAPLAYQWQRNGTDIPGATGASYTLADASAADDGALFRVVVSNAAGSATSTAAELTVTAGGAPVPTITLPATGTRFTAGQPVTFAGSATDPEDGALAPANLTWTVSYFTAGLDRPAVPETSGIAGGTFTPETTTPYLNTDVFYRVTLTATDSSGLSRTTSVDVLPRTADLTVTSNVPGLTLTLDGVPVTAPYTVAAVAGLNRPLAAPLRQELDGVVYDFVGWSDGGAAAHVLSTPEAGGTFTAEYKPRIGTGAGADLTASVDVPPAGPALTGTAGQATVRITNAGTARFAGRVPVGLYLSKDATLDETDAPAGTVTTKSLRLAPGAGKAVRVRFTYPTVAAGDYFLIAEADAGNAAAEADEANNVAAAATATPLMLARIDLTGTFANGTVAGQSLTRGRRASALLDVANTGNVPASGRLEIAVRLIADGAGANAPATDAGVVRVKVKLSPGVSKRLKLKFTPPADLAAGTYRLQATIDPAGTFADVDAANNVVVSGGTYAVA